MTRQEARDNNWLVGECVKCIFWRREAYSGTNDQVREMVTKRGECRRHAPQAMIGTDHDAQGQAIHGSCFEWPVTQENDWCGDAVWSPEIEEKK